MGRSQESVLAYVDPPSLEDDDLPKHLDLIAFCHLRWNFVWQRPQHLMSRWAKTRRVFFVEESIIGGNETFADISIQDGGFIVVPHLRDGVEDYNSEMKNVLDSAMAQHKIETYICWYSTPMALPYTRHLSPQITIYDCMDELSAFSNAPSTIRQYEKELLARAELVFTSGQSLYEARRYQHPNIHVLPSSIDAVHFNQARVFKNDPEDQKEIPHPRVGFFGQIDERMDFDLLRGIAKAMPHCHFVMLGSVVKSLSDSLPQELNIHYLGPKKFEELPAYFGGWEAAIMPLVLKHRIHQISPTRTVEYLAAGVPVVSTSIRDVVRPFGEMKLVHIAGTIDQFVRALEDAFQEWNDERWLTRVDAFLEGTSWDQTWRRMNRLLYQTLKSKSLADDYSASRIPNYELKLQFS